MKPTPPLSYYGGKQKMLRHILPLIPPHEVYVEPFAGGAAVFWAKRPARLEVLNDTNTLVYSFYKAARLCPQALITRLEATLYSRHEYRAALAVRHKPHATTLERAVAFFVLTQQGFCGLIGSWGFGKQPRAPLGVRYTNKIAALRAAALRLRTAQVECMDAIACIRRYDQPGAFMFIDPPYYNSNCGHYGGYTEADFVALLEALRTVQAQWMLTCYPNPHIAAAGRVLMFDQNLSAAAGRNGPARRKTECIVLNYPPPAALAA